MAADFFEFRERFLERGSSSTPSVTTRTSEQSAPAALTVSQLTTQIDRAIRTGLPASVNVIGEVSRPKCHPGSGHLYFTLKDANACIDAIMWKSDVARVRFTVESGLELLATGTVKVFAPNGKYQLYVNRLQPVGAGALELALKQMRAKLETEGLFAAERKRPLPMFPRRIAIVTSRSTAALQDVLKVLRRFSFLELFLYHVPVQGDGAGQQISAALRCLSDGCDAFGGLDVILLTRGGGSLEDLWQFNDESVARAIFASRLPVITGIGHEIDISIADLVADHHAHTPTEAATVLVRHWVRAIESIIVSRDRLRLVTETRLGRAREQFNHLARNEFFRRPTARIDSLRQQMNDRQRAIDAIVQGRLRLSSVNMERAAARLLALHPRHRLNLNSHRIDDLSRRMNVAIDQRLQKHIVQLDAMADRLRAMSPLEVLRRGYSITTNKRTGAVVRSTSELRGGEKLITRLADGEVESIAQDPKQGSLF
ncbi:MAG: exodeoxyribonuclease VII large subunit [Phycisphaerae bacterium]|nr:exodeoxyribonuclease VII large subunit [Phycisphaerae bacterium]